MSQPDRKIRHRDGIPHQRSFHLLMEELAVANGPVNLTRITSILPSTLQSGEFFPQTVRQTFIETIRTQREEHVPQFANVNALLEVGRLLTPHLPQSWATLADIYREVRPLVDGISDRETDRTIIIDKFGEFNKGMMRHIIGEQNETNDFSDKLKTAYLEALSPDAQLTPSDLLTLLYVGEIIAAYLPQSPTTLSDIQRVLGPRILQIEVQMPFRRGDIYSTAYEKLLHAIEHPETTMPTPKPKAQVVFEQPRAPVEKPRRTKVRSIGRQKTQRPRQTRQTKAELRAQEKKARTDQEALLIAQVKELRALTGKDRLTKAQIAARLGISERRVTGIITDLLAAGEIKKSDYRPGKTGIKPETRQLWNRIKKLRNPSRNLSNEQIAARLGITPIHLRNVLTKMIAAGELEPRSSDAPVVERPQSDHTKTLAYQIQDMVELLRTTASSLTNAEIAARLEPHFGQVSERTVARAITLLIQAGRIPSSQGRRPPKQL